MPALISRSRAGLVLKALFGGGLFTWMVVSGKLNLAAVGRSLADWPLMLGILGLGYTQVAITTWRWDLLLRAQNIRLPFGRLWSLTMIGMLFNTVIPGSMGGDLIKGYYIASASAGRKTRAATTLLVDRAAGLTGLLILGGALVLANWSATARSASTRSLGMVAVLGALAGVLGLYAAVLAGKRISRSHYLPAILTHVFEALHEYRYRYSAIPVALTLSIVNQTLSCLMYYLALRAAGTAGLPAGQFFLIVPLGLITSAIPISPGGIGVGQAAFFALFQIVSPGHAAAGTDALTVFQLMFILICLSGLFWYISGRYAESRSS